MRNKDFDYFLNDDRYIDVEKIKLFSTKNQFAKLELILKKYKFRDINNLLIKYGFKRIKKNKMIFRKSFEYLYENTINYIFLII